MPFKWRKLIYRNGVDVTTISGVDVVFFKLVKESSKTNEHIFFTLAEKRFMTHYIAVDFQEFGRFIYKKYFFSVNKIKRYYYNGLKFLKVSKRMAKGWEQKLTNNNDQRLLIGAYREFYKQYKIINDIYSIKSWVSIETWQHDYDEIISRLIAGNGLESQREKIMYSAYRPWKKTAMVRLQDELKGGVKPAQIVKRYQFLRSWTVIWYQKIDEQWVRDIAVNASNQVTLPYSLGKLIKLLKPTKQEEYYLRLAPYLIFFKDWRDDVRREHIYSWSFLFDAIADKFKIKRDDLGYLTLAEIDDVLSTNVLNVEKINYRKKFSCVVSRSDDVESIQIFDQNISGYFKKAMAQGRFSSRHVSEVKGVVAYSGLVRGRAVIVKDHAMLNHVKVGDILITLSTHPNFLSAMQRAAAFVTNEGGMACHAAIVAREFHKPCIIGTKIATDVFKTGDRVEVDATRGIVKKI